MNDLLASNINIESIQLKMVNGCTINAIKDDFITKEILRFGIYEKTLFLFLKKLLGVNKNLNCLDVGANIGVVSLTMAKYAKQVVSFEPISQLYNLLSKSLNDNNFNNCQAENKGLSNANTSAVIYTQTRGNIGSSRLSIQDNEKDDHIKQNIVLEIGDENLAIKKLNSVDVIKIDVEGHETESILGLSETIKKNQPMVILEWNNDLTRDGFNKNQLFEKLFSNYSVFILSNRAALFRAFTKNNKLISPFRSIIRIFFKLLISAHYKEKPLLLERFNPNKDYASVVLMPERFQYLVEELN